MTGEVTFELRDKDGNLKQKEKSNNLIVNKGKFHVINQMLSGYGGATTDPTMSCMAVGTSTTGTDLTDTQLWGEVDRKEFGNPDGSKGQGTGDDERKITYIMVWPAGEATATIGEAGVFNAGAGGEMLCRHVPSNPIPKGATDSLTATWVITFN